MSDKMSYSHGTGTTLVYLTPLTQTPTHNAAIIHRALDIDESSVLHVAGGEHTGIVINKQRERAPDMSTPDIALSFSVWLNDRAANTTTQERRVLNFCMAPGVGDEEAKTLVHDFFKHLMQGFPKDYVSFLKRLMTMLLRGYAGIAALQVEFQLVDPDMQIAIPDAAQYDSSSEVEEVTVGHVQEILEHAFPNGLTLEQIAESLRCSEDEVHSYLVELENSGIARRVDDEWIRYDARHFESGVVDEERPIEDDQNGHEAGRNGNGVAGAGHVGPGGRTIDARYTAFTYGNDHKRAEPTVAIISCLFLEKQAIDAIIQEPNTIHKYKSGGDSNVYTTGRIGSHQVVATKLAVIGDTREAITSAGSITTRLLGNFQHIEHVFVVGVGGAVPHYTDPRKHARLGDVFVSGGCGAAAYIYANDILVDRETHIISGFQVRKWSPQDGLIARLVEEGADGIVEQWHDYAAEAIKRLNANQGDVDWSSPPSSTDVLAMPIDANQCVAIPHPNPDRKHPEIHVATVGAMTNVKRFLSESVDEDMFTHDIRHRFASEYGVRCVDVGFDSVVAAIKGSCIGSWALVRGVADYQHGQSKAAKLWQPYAAARAAAMTKVLIERLPPASN